MRPGPQKCFQILGIICRWKLQLKSELKEALFLLYWKETKLFSNPLIGGTRTFICFPSFFLLLLVLFWVRMNPNQWYLIGTAKQNTAKKHKSFALAASAPSTPPLSSRYNTVVRIDKAWFHCSHWLMIFGIWSGCAFMMTGWTNS